MNSFKDNDFSKRRDTAAQARKALLERFLKRPGPDDPAVAERQAERSAIAAAREARTAERKAERKATQEANLLRQAEEQATREADAAREAADKVVRDAELLAKQKAARDARYAARKARR